MTDPFVTPAAASGGISWSDVKDSLVIVTVLGIEDSIPTVHGPSSAVRADVAVLDGAQKGEVYNDTLVFPKVLQSQLKGRIGQKVLGRVGQGQAKPGQSAPWVLAEATDADRAVGVAYLSGQLATAGTAGGDTPPF